MVMEFSGLYLRSLHDQLPLTVWSVDNHLVMTSISGPVLKLLNLQRDQVIGRSLDDLLTTNELQHLPIAQHRRALLGESVIYQDVFQNMAWEIRLEPLRAEEGEVIGVIGIAQDMSTRLVMDDSLYRSRQMFELVLEMVPQRVFWKDCELKYLGCNQLLAEDAGLSSPAEIIGKTDFDLSWRESAELYRAGDRQVIDTDTPKLDYEELALRANGPQLWVRTNKVPLHDSQGKVIGLLGTYDDITDRKMAEEQLQRANEKLIIWVEELEIRNRVSNVLREMDDLLQVCNYSDEAYSVIQQFCPQLFPGTSGALFLMAQNHRSLEAAVEWGEALQSEHVFTPEDCWALRRMQIHTVNSPTGGLRCRHVPPEFAGNYIGFPMSAAGEMLGLLHIETDPPANLGADSEDLIRTVGEHLSLSLSNLRLRETLRSQSVRDPLTLLFNRRYMEESLDREISRASRKNSSVGLIMLDIDHFKSYNDTHGHDAGDAVLRELGAFLKMHIRAEDIACRFGGEEFILIMPDAPLDITHQRAEQVREAVAGMTVVYQRKSLGAITISVGIAAFPQHGRSADDLLKSADIALYQAKHNGRNRVESA
ncbi:MAG: diguanylate cyclase [Anaerolineaceae bacterium]|nr:diguanylate cyclase [Anaerolineaceae bacterium]